MSTVRKRALFVLLFLIFAAVLLRTAWISDDAAITLRVVLNTAHGNGPVFNPSERVQAFTHPLWFLLLAAAHALVANVFWATFALCIAFSLWAFWYLVARLALAGAGALLAALALILSRAFVDYATSGLENPLAYVLLAWFAREFAASATPRRLAFVAALLYLARPDLALVVAPPLLVTWLRARSPARVAWQTLSGAAPALAWTAFALLYYGFPFPNTAYAKLGTGVAAGDLAAQGVYYFLDSLNRDPLTLTVIALALAAGWRSGDTPLRALALGIALYLAYVLLIGGDFMSGRFLAVPLYGAAILLARLPAFAGARFGALAAMALVVLGFAAPHPNLLSGADFSDGKISLAGIADERGFFFQQYGLIAGNRDRFQEPEWVAARGAGDIASVRVVCGGLGFIGLSQGVWTHLVDRCGLSDPLLARLPPLYNPNWRIGHFEREVPANYLESVRTGENLLTGPGLKEYYDALRLITRGDLFAQERLAAILAFNLGRYDHLIGRARSGAPPTFTVPAARLAEPRAEGSPWNAPGNIVFRRFAPPTVLFDAVQMDRGELDISLDANDTYRVAFLRDGRSLGSLSLGPRALPNGGLARYIVRLPQSLAAGFDRIIVTALEGDESYSLGHLIVR